MKIRTKRLGYLVFALPTLIIVGLLLFQLYIWANPGVGTLEIYTFTQAQGGARTQVPSAASVDGLVSSTPANLTERAGSHHVTFQTISWYSTPSSRDVTIGAGHTATVVGIYVPIGVFIGVGTGSFNVTATVAGAGITPVIWVNSGTSTVTIKGTDFGTATIPVGANFTYVYQNTGTYSYWIKGKAAVSGSVKVE